jgi:hypothetical protein
VAGQALPGRQSRIGQQVLSNMLTRGKLLGVLLLTGLPVLTAVLWLASGRQALTKSNRIVSVTVTDELFGGANVEQQLVRGPLLGYYVGLDLVGAVTVAAVICALIWWWIARRRGRKPEAEKSP